ncbi:hypothetical protein HOD83_00385 [Candidatus Woesearchaeota archaeon]|jgi:hypothetical protein|nr:hypothetical protein [Candidatus Woesearchaeota archaeon]MBT4248034.1 hypothetical protein [Candidatus Woesearchaeota archaeon]
MDKKAYTFLPSFFVKFILVLVVLIIVIFLVRGYFVGAESIADSISFGRW